MPGSRASRPDVGAGAAPRAGAADSAGARQVAEVAVPGYALDLVAASGQVFRWVSARPVGTAAGEAPSAHEEAGRDDAPAGATDAGPAGAGWLVPAFGGVAHVSRRGDALRVDCPAGTLSRWTHYLRVDPEDLSAHEEALRELSSLPDPMGEVIARYGGLRVLRQDPWEAAASFVVSQNNNINRIRGIVRRLCGGPLAPFPDPDELARRVRSDDFGLGYRRPYLLDLCARWPSLEECFARRQGYRADFETLLAVSGIGPKVANCICLYGLGHLEAVPVDTWIRKAQDRHAIRWHPRFGGLQQQMVFEYERAQARHA